MQATIEAARLGAATEGAELSAAAVDWSAFDQFAARTATTLQDVGNLYTAIAFMQRMPGKKHLVFVTENGLRTCGARTTRWTSRASPPTRARRHRRPADRRHRVAAHRPRPAGAVGADRRPRVGLRIQRTCPGAARCRDAQRLPARLLPRRTPPGTTPSATITVKVSRPARHRSLPPRLRRPRRVSGVRPARVQRARFRVEAACRIRTGREGYRRGAERISGHGGRADDGERRGTR